jgi:hypothetical protein
MLRKFKDVTDIGDETAVPFVLPSGTKISCAVFYILCVLVQALRRYYHAGVTHRDDYIFIH